MDLKNERVDDAMREELYEFLLKKDDAVIACSCEEVQSMQMECVSLRSNLILYFAGQH